MLLCSIVDAAWQKVQKYIQYDILSCGSDKMSCFFMLVRKL